MVVAAQNTNNTTIRSIVQQEKLIGPNFTNWFQNLRIILRSEGKLVHLEQPMTPLPYPLASQDTRDAYEALYDAQNEVACLMLGSMSHELQTIKNYKAYDMIQELKTMFEEHAKQELFETVKAFYAYKQEGGQLVSSYLLEMKSHMDTLELLAMQYQMNLNKGKNKLAYAPKTKIPPPPKRDNPAKDSICHHCKECDGLLQPTHDESHKKCKSCISGKMAHKPFPHQVERAKDLLGLIYTDVFQNEVENQLGKKIKAIRSDRGGEYLSYEFVNHMKSCGIVPQLTPPYRPQHIRVSEGMNRTLLDMPRRLIGRLMKYGTGKLPSYPKETMGYYFYYPFENKIFVSSNAEFFENSVIVQETSGSHRLLEMSGSDKGLELIQEEDTQPFENTSEAHNKEYELGDLNEPPNYKAALADPKSDKWLEAMNIKMQSMVDLPSNGRTVGCKWLVNKKTNMDGNVHTFKARLVAKGFTQTNRVGYGETFPPVADIKAIRILLAIATFYDYEKFRMEKSKKGYTPMMKKPYYRELQGAKTPTKVQHMRRVPYASAVGSIMYAVRCTRPDVAFVQILCSRFQQIPGDINWTVVKTILKYLRNTKYMVLVYGEKPKDDLKASCYADASTTTISSTKAEYIAAAKASIEVVWMRKFINGLGDVMPSNERPMEMLCDNEHALAIASDLEILKGPRHFQRKYHYIHEVIQEGEIVLKKFTHMTT
nr:hypothetical protein [Tanacetum cinerariifolium]